MNVLSIEHLTKEYSNHRGIKDVSFSINKGEVLGLLGPNGSGKTTTMKIMTGLLKPDMGNMQIFGINPAENCSAIMEKTGCLIEQPGLYPYLTAKQNMNLASRFYPNLKHNKVDELMELVELSKYKNEKVQNYSMGMKQRLAFALALLPNHELLILDEPTNGLDIKGTVLVRDILKKESEKGVTILVSSHLAHEMEQICTHVAVMEEGSIVDIARVDELINKHASIEKYYLTVTGERKEN